MSEHRRSGARRRPRREWTFALEGLEPRRLLAVTPLPAADGYTPAQMRHAYGFDQLSFGSVPADGRGQTIAIIDATDAQNIVSDLQTFDTQFSLPAPPSFKIVNQTGGSQLPPADSPNDATETTLDVEWSHAIAPMANILLVEANSLFPSDLAAAIDFARHAPGVSTVSMSFGGSEIFQWNFGQFMSDLDSDGLYTTPPGHQGVTFIASAGDFGTQIGVQNPAASPNVLSVGGTSLNFSDQSGAYGNEAYWSGTNSGYSNIEVEPPYQEGVQRTGNRSVPDVTYNADPNTGVAIYDSFTDIGVQPPSPPDPADWFPIGGTSAGAPQWAGLLAIANQGRVLHGLGTLDGPTQTLPILYSLYSPPLTPGFANYTKYFNDVTTPPASPFIQWRWGGTGLNDQVPIQGFDTATGLGSPKAAALIPALATLSAPPPLSLSASVVKGPPAAVIAGDAGSLKLRLTNTAGTTFDQPVAVNLYAAPISGGGAQTPVGTVDVGTLDLKPGVGKNVKLKFTYPTGMPNGKYSLVAAIVAPESNSTPTRLTVPMTVSIAPPTVDLTPSPGDSVPVLVRPGSQSTGSIFLKNVGNVDAIGTVNLTLYASAHRTLDSSATLLPSVPGYKVRIRPGKSVKLHFRFFAPTNLTGGSYFVLASVSDSTNPADTNMADKLAAIATRAS